MLTRRKSREISTSLTEPSGLKEHHMTYIAKVFWPDHMVTLTETRFEALGQAVGQHLEEAFRLQPVKVEFNVIFAD